MKSKKTTKIPQIVDIRGLLAYLILHELSSKKLCGDELAHCIGKRRCGNKLTPGTIYPALKALREHKLVKLQVKGRRKVYTLSPLGKREYTLAKNILKNSLKSALK